MREDFQNLNQIFATERDEQNIEQLKIAFIHKEENEHSQNLLTGARQTAAEKNIYLESFAIEPTDQMNLKDYYQLSLMSDFDGIIVEGTDPELIDLINRAFVSDLPTVTISSDLPESSRVSYVGTDHHQAGYIIGRKMLDTVKDNKKQQLAIISTDYQNSNTISNAEYLKIFGFKEAISTHSEAEILEWERVPQNMIDSQQNIKELLEENPKINGIFITQSAATLAAANLLENYPQKDIVLMGYGNNQEIRNFIDQDIISYSVFRDSALIGKNSVREINSYLRESTVNLYSNIEINILE